MKRLESFSLSGGVGQFLLLLLAAMSGVLFFPFTLDAYGLPRLMLFFWIALLFALLWIWQTVTSRRVSFTFTGITAWSLALGATALLSAVLAPNPLEQVVGKTMAMVALAIIMVFGVGRVPQLRWSSVLAVLITVSIPLNIIFWWQASPWWKLSGLLNNAFGLQLPNSILFSFLESPLALSTFLVFVTISGVLAWMQSQNRLSGSGKFLLAGIVFNLITLMGIAFFFWKEPSLRPVMLPYRFGWEIAVENFKSFRSMLIGVGPEQFLSAFGRSRGVSFNTTDIWAIRFSASSSELLHSLTTMGLLNLIAWVGLFLAALRTIPWLSLRKDGALIGALITLIVMFVVIPFNITAYILLTLVLVCLINRTREEHEESVHEVIVLLSAIKIMRSNEVKPSQTYGVFALFVSLLVFVFVAAMAYGSGRVYASHAVYFQSLLATQRNEAQATYSLQQRAISLYPYNPLFRRTYALTNMAIADSLSKNPNLSEQQKQLLANLLQQAVREGRLAAQLNQTETASWEALASVYSRVMSIEGAADWTVAAMTQAIQTDPISPQLRLQLGSVYLQLKQLDQGLRLYEQALQLKPDWYTALYRYGEALGIKGDYALAAQAYERALSLAPAGSEDAAVIEKALNEARQKAESNAQKAAENKALPPNNASPSLPETPKNDGDFEKLLDDKQTAPTPAPSQEQSTATKSGNIVLPNL